MLQAAKLGEVSRCLWPLYSPGSYNFTIGFFELVQAAGWKPVMTGNFTQLHANSAVDRGSKFEFPGYSMFTDARPETIGGEPPQVAAHVVRT